MNKYKIDCYGYIFNASKFDFKLEETAENFTSFFDEVYCATVPSEDDTRERLAVLEEKYSNFHVIDSNIQIEGNRYFDGQLKTLAMNACKNKYRAIVDYDEFFNLKNRPKWDWLCEKLEENPQFDGFLVPSIDCWKSKNEIRANVNIGQKFRLHKDTVFERGVPGFAKRGDGTFNTNQSDSTEPITEYGELCNFASFVNPTMLTPLFCNELVNVAHCFHFGSIDFKRRAKIGKDFWKSRWQERSGREENVIIDERELEMEPTCYHNLPLN